MENTNNLNNAIVSACDALDPEHSGECWPDPVAWDGRPLAEQASDLLSLLDAEIVYREHDETATDLRITRDALVESADVYDRVGGENETAVFVMAPWERYPSRFPSRAAATAAQDEDGGQMSGGVVVSVSMFLAAPELAEALQDIAAFWAEATSYPLSPDALISDGDETIANVARAALKKAGM